MTDTVHLGLPTIEGAQAQKHVTHNDIPGVYRRRQLPTFAQLKMPVVIGVTC